MPWARMRAVRLNFMAASREDWTRRVYAATLSFQRPAVKARAAKGPLQYAL